MDKRLQQHVKEKEGLKKALSVLTDKNRQDENKLKSAKSLISRFEKLAEAMQLLDKSKTAAGCFDDFSHSESFKKKYEKDLNEAKKVIKNFIDTVEIENSSDKLRIEKSSLIEKNLIEKKGNSNLEVVQDEREEYDYISSRKCESNDKRVDLNQKNYLIETNAILSPKSEFCESYAKASESKTKQSFQYESDVLIDSVSHKAQDLRSKDIESSSYMLKPNEISKAGKLNKEEGLVKKKVHPQPKQQHVEKNKCNYEIQEQKYIKTNQYIEDQKKYSKFTDRSNKEIKYSYKHQIKNEEPNLMNYYSKEIQNCAQTELRLAPKTTAKPRTQLRKVELTEEQKQAFKTIHNYCEQEKQQRVIIESSLNMNLISESESQEELSYLQKIRLRLNEKEIESYKKYKLFGDKIHSDAQNITSKKTENLNKEFIASTDSITEETEESNTTDFYDQDITQRDIENIETLGK